MRPLRRKLITLLGAWLVTASACDEPAPLVLGRLERRTPDAGSDAQQDATAPEHARDSDDPPSAEHDDTKGFERD